MILCDFNLGDHLVDENHQQFKLLSLVMLVPNDGNSCYISRGLNIPYTSSNTHEILLKKNLQKEPTYGYSEWREFQLHEDPLAKRIGG